MATTPSYDPFAPQTYSSEVQAYLDAMRDYQSSLGPGWIATSRFDPAAAWGGLKGAMDHAMVLGQVGASLPAFTTPESSYLEYMQRGVAADDPSLYEYSFSLSDPRNNEGFGTIYNVTPDSRYRLTNKRGSDSVVGEYTGRAGLDQLYADAMGLRSDSPTKANWLVEQYNPATDEWAQVARDVPATTPFVGKLIKGLTSAGIGAGLGVGLAPALGAIGAGAAGGGASGFVGSGGDPMAALKGAVAGAALGGLADFAGVGAPSVGGGSTGGAAAGGGLALDPNIINVIANTGAPTAAALGAGVGGGLSSFKPGTQNYLDQLGPTPDDIIVSGVKASGGSTLPLAAGGLGLGGLAAAGAGGGSATATVAGGGPAASGGAPAGASTPDPITVSANKPAPGLGLDDIALGGAAFGLPATAAAAGGGGGGGGVKGFASDLSKYLQAAGLITGLAGDLFGSGGGDSAARIPAGWGQSMGDVFSASLPAATMPGLGAARTMPAQDWTRYGMRPEQSFYTSVPQGYTPPAPGLPDTTWDRDAYRPRTAAQAAVPAQAAKPAGSLFRRYASGGRADDVPAMLSDGEYVIDAETVAMLGDGSNKAGAKKLDDLRVNLRKHKGRNLAKGRFSHDAREPMAYMKGRN